MNVNPGRVTPGSVTPGSVHQREGRKGMHIKSIQNSKFKKIKK